MDGYRYDESDKNKRQQEQGIRKILIALKRKKRNERTCQNSGKERERCMIKFVQASAKSMRKAEYSADAAQKKKKNDREIKGCDGVQNIVVLPDQNQNERSGNSGQDHGAYRNKTGEKNNGITRFKRKGRCEAEPKGEKSSCKKAKDGNKFMGIFFLYFRKKDKQRRKNKPEKERPNNIGICFKKHDHDTGEQKDSRTYAEQKGQGEAPRNFHEGFFYLQCEKKFEKFLVNGLYRIKKFSVYAGNECDCSA